MGQKEILATLMILFTSAILFTPKGTDIYKIPMLFAILFGVLWFFKN